MRRHGTTQRLPREHLETEELPRLRPLPTEPYEIPQWSRPKVAPDQHAQVARALYSLPGYLKGRRLDARADSTTVRFYDHLHRLVKAHPRVAPGKRQTDTADFPPEKLAYAMRDVGFLLRRAAEHGEAVGRYAAALLDSRLPWTRMRQVYALLGLIKRYGAVRIDQACQTALEVDLVNIYKLRRLIDIAASRTESAAPSLDGKVVPLARFLRPPQQFALKLSSNQEDTKGDNQE